MENQKKKHPYLIVIGIVFALFILLIIISVSLFGAKSLKTEDYIRIKTSGADGFGKIHADMNYSMLESELENNGADIGALINLESSIKVSASPSENLKNGDIVLIKLSYNKNIASDYGIKFDKTEFEVTVSDLAQAEPIDPFENLKVTFSGVSPYGKVDIDTSGCDKFSKSNIRFISDSEKVKNGDTIKIIAEYNESAAENSMVYITQTEKEYTVSGLSEYISSLDDINMTDIENSISDKILAEVSKSRSDGAIFGLGYIAGEMFEVKSKYNFENLKSAERYLCTKKPESYSSDANILYTIYEISINETNGNSQKKYINVSVKNILKQTDGSLTYDNIDARGYDSIESVRNKINSIKDNYTAEQISTDGVIVPEI
ncbi:MAG: hypothetical protein IJ736_10945 [Firmicutes bacterium]|nr:hypothetical protein [Bacillota bacterium]